jgi:hypothetical protein
MFKYRSTKQLGTWHKLYLERKTVKFESIINKFLEFLRIIPMEFDKTWIYQIKMKNPGEVLN